MKRIISLLLASAFCLTIMGGCTNGASDSTDGTTDPISTTEILEGKDMLDGKKIIFIGNSFTYYGKCVLEKSQSEYGLENRTNDIGYFYRICKENGVNVSVTNFTFGGHGLQDFYSGNCQAGRGHNGLNHLDYLTDMEYDYVVLQNGSRSAAMDDILTECENLMKLFRDANPNVKFVFLVQHRVHSTPYQWRSTIKKLEDAGVTVVDWGALVNDVMTGVTEVPGATQTYDQNSFIISKSESDGFHPNMLTGYITALMTYCAITGESAVGQPWNFGDNDILFGTTAIAAFRSEYYTFNRITNFDSILASETDMTGLQTLIDEYLEAKGYRNYE